jgi:NAD dependent epimerase/dehydratase family enzyme
VVFLRTGVVLSPRGGALQALQIPAKCALGVPLGSGRQVMPLISLPDWIAAVRFLAERPDIAGPVNITLPVPATNAELTAAVNTHLHRPQPPIVRVPAGVLRLALNGFATELLDSVTIVPQVLTDAGFTFEGADVTSAVAAAYGS